MSANPALTVLPNGTAIPTPFPGETLVMSRPGTEIAVEGVRTQKGSWKARGTLFLTNIRMVFTANKADASGLVGFDLPIVYLRGDKFNQPIFGANNLSGECWPAEPNGGPLGSLPPYKFSIYFKEGGCGTFTSYYFKFREHYAAYVQQVQAQQTQAPPSFYNMPQNWQNAAFVDPSDPSTIYLAQPVQEQLPTAPQYSPLYGKDDAPYEGMGLKP